MISMTRGCERQQDRKDHQAADRRSGDKRVGAAPLFHLRSDCGNVDRGGRMWRQVA
jgi:hypothetical protein